MLNYLNILLLLLLASKFGAFAQPYYFNRTYDITEFNLATSVLPIDSGYLILGQIVTTINREFLLVRIDMNGDTIWTKSYGEPPNIYFTGLGKSLIKTVDSGYAFAGTFRDTANVGNAEALLVKFNTIGDTLWTKKYGGSQTETASQCLQTLDKGYILVGTTCSFGNGACDVYLIKTDSVGDTIWTKTYGGGGFDAGYSIGITNDGGYIIGASLTQGGDFIWVIKTDSLGNTEWNKSINVNLNVGCSAFQSKNGDYIIYTFKDNLAGNNDDGYLAKLNSSGDTLLWEKTYVGSGGNDWFAQAIELEDGSIVASGSSRNNQNVLSGWLMKVASNGDSLWSRKYSVPDSLQNQFFSLHQTLDSGFVLAGNALAPTQDFWVVKTNCLGFDAPPQAGFVFTDSTMAVFTNQSQNAGNYLWYFGDGDTSSTTNPTHAYQDSGTYIVTLVATACGDTSIFTDTISVSSTVGVNEFQVSDFKLQIAPNPFSNSTTITYQFPLNTGYGEILIYDILGNVIDRYEITGISKGQIEYNNEKLLSGIYYCQYSKNHTALKTVKFVVVK